VFSYLRRLLLSYKAERIAHDQAWSPVAVRDADGLTRFQHLARGALEREFGPLALEPQGQRETYLKGLVPGTSVEVYLYEDEFQLHGKSHHFCAEHWDYQSPDAMLAELVLQARRSQV
jgi:hypothetical protein